ncbi:MAG: Ig-like domain-containing protein [Gaiellaceae bacterium]
MSARTATSACGRTLARPTLRSAVAALAALFLLGLVGSSQAATTSITPGGPSVRLEVTVAGATEAAAFEGTAGQRVSLEITDVTIGTSACCSTKVLLLRPDGTTLKSLTVGTNGAFLDATTLPVGGTYTIVVDPQSTNTGGATLTLHDVPPDVGGPILAGGLPVTVALDTPGQNARLTVSGTAGQRVAVETTGVTFSGKLTLLQPDGKTLVSASIGTSGGFLDATTLPTTGAYTLLVDPTGTATGDATLTLVDVPPDVAATIVPGGPAVTVTTSVPGQNARVAFSGVANQRVSLAVTDPCCSTRVTILRPDGKTLASATAGAAGGFIDAVSLPTSGTYAILVDPQGPGTGSVTLRLYDVPADAAAAIVPGGAAVGATTTVPGQNARLTFSGVAGRRVSIVVGPACCAARVSILKPNGTTLVGPVTTSVSGGFVDATTLPVTGTYTIVADVQGAATGSLTFTLYDVPADIGGTVTPGGPAVTVTTSVPGQNARLTFAGSAGQRISLKIGPSCCSVRVTLLKPNGASLAATNAGTSGGFLETTTLPVSGTYAVVVDPQGSATGSVTLTLYDVPADVAHAIVPGGGTVTVSLGVPGQNARLAFDGAAGQRVSLEVTGSCCTAAVSLLKPDGTTLVSMSIFGANAFLDTQTLPSTGTYTIVFDPQGSATGSATFELHDVPPDVTGTLVAGSPLPIALATPGQNARLTFSGAAGQRVSIELSSVTIGSSLGGTKVSLLKPDGSTLVAPVTVGTNGASVGPVSLPVNGTYAVIVDPQGANTGSMTVTLHDVPGDFTGSIVPGGAPVAVTIVAPGQDARITFAGTAGQRVSLELTDVTIASAKVSFLDPAGGTLVGPLSVGTGGGFVDAVMLPATGTYTIFLDPQGTATGNATLRLYDVPPDATAAATPGGAAVTVTTSTPGQNAAVTFTGTAGQRVSMRIGPTCCITKVTVMSPDGTILFGPSSFGTGGGFVDTELLPVLGTYTVLVDPFGTATGSVTLTLYDVPADVTGTIAPGSSLTLTTSVPGQNSRATLAGTADTGIKLTVGPFNCCSTKVSILNPDGTTLVPATSFPPDGGALLARLPLTGTYTILVDPQGAATGSVHLALELDTTAPAPPTLTLSESAPDSHVVGASFYYRPAGSGGSFAVGATSSDGGTGLQKVRFPGLGSGFTPASAVDDTLSPYTQTYTWSSGAGYSNSANLVTAYDRVGNTSSAPFGVYSDTAAPTTTDNTSAIGSGWKNTTQFVVLSASDGTGAGPAITYYTADGSTPTSSSAQGTTVSLSTDGVYTVEYFSVDHVGNVEAVRTAGTQVRIDKTNPSSAVLDPLPATIKNGQVLTGSGADALSGLASIAYYYCAGSNCTPSVLIGSSSTPPGYGVTWSAEPADGTYQLLARAVDAAGNTLDSAKRTVVIDNTAPNTTITSAPANPTNQTGASFSFSATEGGSTFECRLDGGAFATCTSPRTYAGLAVGSHAFEVRATDPVGNIDPSPASFSWTIDLTPPETTITMGPASPTNSTSPSFTFTSSEAGSSFQCALDGSVFSPCTSPKSYTGLAAGSHTFEVRATDPAGNTDGSPAAHTWTIDTSAPETTITSAPASPTNQTNASFSFASEPGATFQCRLDGSAFAACTSPRTYTGLAAGSHTFEVRAIDTAGNADSTPAAGAWTIDLTAPQTTITAGPADPTNQTDATFSFISSEAGSSFECALDGGAFAGCASPMSYTTLAEGAHTFEIRATDPAANTDATPAALGWTVDLTPPETSITSAPSSPTNSTSPALGFASSEAGSSFECRLDGGAFAACTSPKSYAGLAAGTHTFEVRATDPAGNTDGSPAAHTWTIDTSAPDTTITTAPSSPTNQTSAAFTFASEPGAGFECRLDAGAFGSCTSPKTYAGLAAGTHTFEVRALDAAGNTDPTPASSSWTIDTSAPDTIIASGPADPTNQTSADFTFTADEAGSSFECALEGGPFAACTTPKSYSALAEGSHTFAVRATDAAGNTDASPAGRSWTIDTSAPETTITSGPVAPTNQTSASFTFASEPGATFACRLDAGVFGSCTSPETYSGLAAGAHTVEVRATDAAGNADPTPAAWSWTVDTTAPDTSIVSAPADPTNQTSAAFTSASEPGASFECALDGGAFAACPSPKSYSGLAAGTHTFEVRATDPAGNTDPTPAFFSWTIDTSAPDTIIASGPADPTNQTSGSFSLSSSEAGSSFECALDGAPFATCTSPESYTGLAEGTHTFQARATDPAGNTDPSAANHTWTVDLTPPAPPTIDSPAEGSTSATGTIALSGTAEPGSTVEVFEGATSTGSTTAGPDGAWSSTLSSVPDGSHSYTATARDAAGNTSLLSSARTVIVDTSAPNTTIGAGPIGSTPFTTATFSFSADEAGSSFECALDGAPFAACTSPKSYSGLAEGSHTFSARAIDSAGNVDPTPASRTWTVDTTAPDPPVITSPADGSTNTTGTVALAGTAEPGSVVEIFDGGVSKAFATTTAGGTWARTLTGVGNGSHSYTATARDAASNTSAPSTPVTVLVDTVPPETTITSAPSDPSASADATFAFDSSELGSTFECSLDGAPFAACASPTSYTGLGPGAHTFEVRAADPAGNTDASPAAYSWTVT